jgi:uncharacterized protein YcgI (DUF1989 family)
MTAMSDSLLVIPARRGMAALVGRGQTVTVINTHREQVVDTWAFTAPGWASSCRWSIAVPAGAA